MLQPGKYEFPNCGRNRLLLCENSIRPPVTLWATTANWSSMGSEGIWLELREIYDCLTAFFSIPQGGGGRTHTKHQSAFSCYLGTRLSLRSFFSLLFSSSLPSPSPLFTPHSHLLTYNMFIIDWFRDVLSSLGRAIHPSISPQPTRIQGNNIYFIIYLHHLSWGHKRAVANSPLSITHGPTTLWHDMQHTILTRDTQNTHSHTHTHKHIHKARHIIIGVLMMHTLMKQKLSWASSDYHKVQEKKGNVWYHHLISQLFLLITIRPVQQECQDPFPRSWQCRKDYPPSHVEERPLGHPSAHSSPQ